MEQIDGLRELAIAVRLTAEWWLYESTPVLTRGILWHDILAHGGLTDLKPSMNDVLARWYHDEGN